MLASFPGRWLGNEVSQVHGGACTSCSKNCGQEVNNNYAQGIMYGSQNYVFMGNSVQCGLHLHARHPENWWSLYTCHAYFAATNHIYAGCTLLGYGRNYTPNYYTVAYQPES